jgi:drug/metabolite transporter (DMT)-like permease
MAYGAFWFSAMGMFVKLSGQRLPSMQIVLVRAIITLVLSWLLIKRERINPWTGPHKLLILRGLLGATALICFYYSLVNLPLAEATVIQYMNPLLVTVLAMATLGERPGRREWLAIVVSLIGVLIIARPAAIFGESNSLQGFYVLVALTGSVFSSIAYITVRQLRHQHSALVVVFYFPLVTVPIALPLALPGWVNPTLPEWGYLLGVGVTTQIAQVYMTRGLQLEEAVRATTVGYLQIVFAAIWGALVFHQLPDGWSAVGALIIALSTFSVLSRQPITPQPRRPAGPGV